MVICNIRQPYNSKKHFFLTFRFNHNGNRMDSMILKFISHSFCLSPLLRCVFNVIVVIVWILISNFIQKKILNLYYKKVFIFFSPFKQMFNSYRRNENKKIKFLNPLFESFLNFCHKKLIKTTMKSNNKNKKYLNVQPVVIVSIVFLFYFSGSFHFHGTIL